MARAVPAACVTCVAMGEETETRFHWRNEKWLGIWRPFTTSVPLPHSWS